MQPQRHCSRAVKHGEFLHDGHPAHGRLALSLCRDKTSFYFLAGNLKTLLREALNSEEHDLPLGEGAGKTLNWGVDTVYVIPMMPECVAVISLRSLDQVILMW